MTRSSDNEARIYYEENEVGRIVIADNGALEFRYDASWLLAKDSFPLSVTMPLGPEAFGDSVVAPWLANLLPEGDLLASVARALGLSSSDALPILRAIGGDTAGAISVSSPSVRSKWKYIPLTERYGGTEEEALEHHIQDVERKPFLVGEEGIRISLAGGQQKTALAVLDDDGAPCLEFPGQGRRLAIPASGAPSTIVIKPNNPLLLGDVESEAYCLELARIVGIPAAKVRILRVNNRNALAVIRYDRRKMPDGSIKRLHQEDFAQTNGIFPAQKYERGLLRGLNMEGLLSTRVHLPPVERLRLLDQLIYRIERLAVNENRT